MPPGLSGPPANLAALIANKVKADQTSVTLKPGGSAQVTFANSALGPMTLKVDTTPPGVTADPPSAE